MTDLYLTDINYDNMPVFDFRMVKFTKNKELIIDEMIGHIDNQNYLYCNLDTYYITEKYDSGKRHYWHDLLIYGYDKSQKHFLCLTYDQTRHLNKIKMTFDEFKTGLYSEYLEPILDNISLCKVKKGEIKLDPQRIKLELLCYCYIYHTDTITLHYIREYIAKSTDSQFFFDYIFGHECQYYFRVYCEYIRDKKLKADLRVCRLFWEYKVLMLERFKALNELYDLSEEIEQYSKIVNSANIIFNSILKYTLAGNADCFGFLENNRMDDFLKNERVILRSVFHKLPDFVSEDGRISTRLK